MTQRQPAQFRLRGYSPIGILIGVILVLSAGIVTLVSKPHNTPGNITSPNGTSATSSSAKIKNTQYKVGATKTIEYGDGSYDTTPDISGSLTVKLTGIIDPDTTTTECGKLVAVEFSLKNSTSIASTSSYYGQTGNTYSDDAAQDVSITGSDGIHYTPDDSCYGKISVSGCSSLVNYDEGGTTEVGSYSLDSNGTLSGCVPFLLPQKVSVSKVDFNTVAAYYGIKGGLQEWGTSLQEVGNGAEWTMK